MVLITKDEKDYISKNFPKAHIVRTMKQKSKRHRYYCEEAPAVMRYLANVRYPEEAKAVRNGSNKKTGRK